MRNEVLLTPERRIDVVLDTDAYNEIEVIDAFNKENKNKPNKKRS